MLSRSLLRQPRLVRIPVARTPVPFRPRPLARWYSDKVPEQPTTIDDVGETKAAESESPLKAELEKKDREVIELKDKYLRSVADFRNLQERTKREVQSAKDFAIQRFAKDLMESIDIFDRAFDAIPAEKLAEARKSESQKDLINLYDGLKMTETILMDTCKKHGLERFDPAATGDKFDPNMHEALFQAAIPDKTPGTVFATQQKGFLLNGRVLRAAKVGVVKAAE